ncbi:hypothetical protein [Nocardia sp. CA-290969]|uniref:hypothetical protein n=1 Tax=Nocardia sp. CA-290969 TaxID=3239986 RepID=UPI003D91A219
MSIDGGRHTMDFVHVVNLADGVVLSLTRGIPRSVAAPTSATNHASASKPVYSREHGS